MDNQGDRSVDLETNAAGLNIGAINSGSGTTIVAGRDVNVNLTLASQAITEIVALSGRSARVREEVLLWQDNFDDVCRSIKMVGDFKDLHDLFHRLLIDCYNPIQQEIGRFPNDPISQVNLDQYGLAIGAMLEESQLLLESSTFQNVDTSWLGELQEAHQQLQQALQNGDALSLRGASRLLRHLLNIQPTIINNRLTQAARSLDLNKLVDALQKIVERVDPQQETADGFAQINSGIDTLQKTNTQLSAQIGVHDRWQGLENELRQLESNLEDIDLVWKFLKTNLMDLCSPSTSAPWAAGLLKTIPLLDQSLAGGDSGATQRIFLSLKAQVGMRFYTVDFELKRMCGKLRDIENPLRAMRTIQ